MHRRDFLSAAALAGCTPILPALLAQDQAGPPFAGIETVGPIRAIDEETPLAGARWYSAETEGAGFVYRFPTGLLARSKYVYTDMLLDGNELLTFSVDLHEGSNGRVFQYAFGGLNQCSFRLRMALELVNQNRFFLDREGGLLKPMCLGDRVDLDKVDRMVFTLRRKGPGQVRWAMTDLRLTTTEPARLAHPILPKGVLLDEFGQSALREWPGKTRSLAELKARIQTQYETTARQSRPDELSPWGGWKSKKLTEGAGFFRTHHDGRRWWLVDPDGYAFWSAGLDDVRVDVDSRYDGIEAALKWLPEPADEFSGIYHSRGPLKAVNYLAANLIRSLGADGWRDKWAAIALAEMKRLRFNTVGNWSEWEYARAAKFPYVRPLSFHDARTRMVYRDFPDVFDPEFEKDAVRFATQLQDTVADPAFLGYFLMNEPAWGSSSVLPAAGMLYNTESCATRGELARFLKSHYITDEALTAAWKMSVSVDRIGAGKWTGGFTPQALRDLQDFSVIMVARYFQTLSQACRKADPNHLNLGMRWAGVPPLWAVEGMKCFDVFSLNCYRDKLPRAQSDQIHQMIGKPVMVGEWHFGALDVGLPASGIGHLKNQEERAKAYRVYIEDAAANPNCVGAHWFTLYDESALGRSDGENYNIGFLDVCNRAYEALGNAATASHERLYPVADGQAEPFQTRVEYLPKLYL